MAGEKVFNCWYEGEHSLRHLEWSTLNRAMRGEVGESEEERGPRAKSRSQENQEKRTKRARS